MRLCLDMVNKPQNQVSLDIHVCEIEAAAFKKPGEVRLDSSI